jgi:hypothetical protein
LPGTDLGLLLPPPQAFFVDPDGYILEAPTANIGMITQDRKLVVPPFDACIAGITMTRVMELVGEVRAMHAPAGCLLAGCVPAWQQWCMLATKGSV